MASIDELAVRDKLAALLSLTGMREPVVAADELLAEHEQHVRREMAAELSDWIRAQANQLRGATTSGAWKRIADKIDPRKVPSRNGLRSYWNQGDTW